MFWVGPSATCEARGWNRALVHSTLTTVLRDVSGNVRRFGGSGCPAYFRNFATAALHCNSLSHLPWSPKNGGIVRRRELITLRPTTPPFRCLLCRHHHNLPVLSRPAPIFKGAPPSAPGGRRTNYDSAGYYRAFE